MQTTAETDLNDFEVLLCSWNLRAERSQSWCRHAFSQPALTAMANCTSEQSFPCQINSFTLLSWTVPSVHQWGTPDSLLDITVISGLASSRDQGSAIDTLRSQVTKSPQTQELRKQPSFKRSKTQWRTLQTNKPWCMVRTGEKRMLTLEQWASAKLRTEIQKHMRTNNSETHVHTKHRNSKNTCAHWHSTDLRGHDDPWTQSTRTALTGTVREASACLLESAAALRTRVHIRKIGQRTKSTRQTGRVDQSAGVNPLTRRSIQYTFFWEREHNCTGGQCDCTQFEVYGMWSLGSLGIQDNVTRMEICSPSNPLQPQNSEQAIHFQSIPEPEQHSDFLCGCDQLWHGLLGGLSVLWEGLPFLT